MKGKPETRTVSALVKLMKAQMLKANAEYQRGVVWSDSQKKKLVDSVMRGYPLPLIYLHHIKTDVEGMQREDLEIIDGQQRLQSLYEFAEGAFKLFDPILDDKKARFPAFIKKQECPLGGKDFASLTADLQKQFLDTPLNVAKIQSSELNEVRDLFVRLQSGLPLNHQETRDALPGDFTDFVLKLGGKPQIARYPGHEFFTRTLRMNPATDRGKTRQLAAQVAMLFLSRRRSPSGELPDINAAAINDFYYQNIDFDIQSVEALRLRTILDCLSDTLDSKKHPKLHGHDAIHLVLLADSLWDDYAPDWKDRLPIALNKFLHNFAEVKKDPNNFSNPYLSRYAVLTRYSSDRGSTIGQRHRFYMEEMHKFLEPLKRKDPNRLYGELDRTILFFRQGGKCLVCDGELDWRDCEVHHVEEHSRGGETSLENGAAVHKKCHPKGQLKTQHFAEKFASWKAAQELLA